MSRGSGRHRRGALEQFDYFSRKAAELRQADLAETPAERSRHEEQARAYDKIIAVLQREEQRGARGII